MTRTRWSLAIALLLLANAAFGQNASEVAKQAESSMLVTGAIEIDAEGHLASMTIDNPEALPPVVVRIVSEASKGWTFEPQVRDGKAVRAKGPMTLRIVATRFDDQRVNLQIRSATFGSDAGNANGIVSAKKMSPPSYPMTASQSGVTGTVYLIVRVGADGKVQDVAAEQTNLGISGTGIQMKKFRTQLEHASIDAARKWTFVPPTEGENKARDHWLVRVPVDYSIPQLRAKPKYGEWTTYVPGPRDLIPWAERDVSLAGGDRGADAMSAGGVYEVGSGLQLKTPLQPGS